MRKKRNISFQKKFLFLGALFCFVFLSQIRSENQNPENPTVGVTPKPTRIPLPGKLKSDYVKLLKQQADERKEFYENQSNEKVELKKSVKSELNDLLEKHRAARTQFMNEKHTGEERRTFFLGQRNEMAEKKKALKEKQIQLERDHKERLKDFLSSQKSERKRYQEK